MKYFSKPKFDIPSIEKTLAKKQFSKFFTDEMPQSTTYFYELDEDQNDYTVYEADSVTKRKMAKPEMSIAKYACSGHNKKLFFGKPNPLLMIEDLAYRLSLQELEDILEETM